MKDACPNARKERQEGEMEVWGRVAESFSGAARSSLRFLLSATAAAALSLSLSLFPLALARHSLPPFLAISLSPFHPPTLLSSTLLSCASKHAHTLFTTTLDITRSTRPRLQVSLRASATAEASCQHAPTPQAPTPAPRSPARTHEMAALDPGRFHETAKGRTAQRRLVEGCAG
eukprot:3917253-Rhodomonas_salina.1